MRSRAHHGVAGPSATPWSELTAAGASPVVAPDDAPRDGGRGVVRVACLEGARSLETPRAPIAGRPDAPNAPEAVRDVQTPRTDSLRLLIVEDSPAYATLVEHMLSDTLSDELDGHARRRARRCRACAARGGDRLRAARPLAARRRRAGGA